MSKVILLVDVGRMMKIAPFAVACVVIFAGFHTFLSGLDVYVEYDLDEMNEFWESSENHTYATRTNPSQQSVDIADRIISQDAYAASMERSPNTAGKFPGADGVKV